MAGVCSVYHVPIPLANAGHHVTLHACQLSSVADPTPKQALEAAKRLAATRRLGVHDRCTPDLRLLQLEPDDARDLVATAAMSQIVKSECDHGGRAFWVLELSIPHRNSPTGRLYVQPVLHLPTLGTGYILSCKPSTD